LRALRRWPFARQKVELECGGLDVRDVQDNTFPSTHCERYPRKDEDGKGIGEGGCGGAGKLDREEREFR